jgi:hypothetical protein
MSLKTICKQQKLTFFNLCTAQKRRKKCLQSIVEKIKLKVMSEKLLN